MKKEVIGVVCVGIVVIVILAGLYYTGNLPANPPTTPSPPPLPFQGSLATNWNEYGEPENLPEGDDFVAISSGTGHFLALRSNGSIECRGLNMYGQCNVPDESDFVAVSAGSEHSLALRSNGTIACWGANSFNECNVPKENNFVAISAGYENSLALRSNGTIACWGGNRSGECTIPPEDDFISVVIGSHIGYALHKNGKIACLGSYIEACDPAPRSDIVAISAYDYFSYLALTSTGELLTWNYIQGWNQYRPPGNNYIAISAGHGNNLALRSDGTIVCWGSESYKCNFSSVQDAIAISAGYQNLAITNPCAEEILAYEWQKTKERITSTTGGIDLIQPQPSRMPAYPVVYVINTTLPVVPDKVMVYKVVHPESLEEKFSGARYLISPQDAIEDPYHFIAYRDYGIKTPIEAIEEVKTYRLDLNIDQDFEWRYGSIDTADRIEISDISLGYEGTGIISGISGNVYLQPLYRITMHVQKGNVTSYPFWVDVPATENLVEFDFLN